MRVRSRTKSSSGGFDPAGEGATIGETIDATEEPCRVLREEEVEALRQLAASMRIADRRECLRRLYWATNAANAEIVYELAEFLAHDHRQEIRWDAVDRLHWLVRKAPDRCWALILRLGGSRCADLRDAVAAKLLPELPDSHFHLVRERVLAGDWRMREMLRLRERHCPGRWLKLHDRARYNEQIDRDRELEALAPPYWLVDVAALPGGAGARNRIGRKEPRWLLTPPCFSAAERETLRYLAASPEFVHRFLCLEWLGEGKGLAANDGFVLELAEDLAWDHRDEVCCTALGILERSLEREPERVWEAFLRLSASTRPGLLGYLSAFVLEHLLELDCDTYLPRVRARIEAGSWRMASMLAGSWILGTARDHEEEIQALLVEHRRLLRPL